MTHSIRRQFLFLHAYVITTLVVFLGLVLNACNQRPMPQKLTEITAERINIVDADGTLRMVISNKDRMHPGVIGGRVMQRPRPYSGIIFFNDQGDESGGLTLTGREQGGQRMASASLNFDQLGQDQTIGFAYNEQNGARSAGFNVWDRPDAPLTGLIDALNAANAIQNQAERDAATARALAAAPKGPQRVFVGKSPDRVAMINLSDSQGHNRLALKVDADGNASIEFRDAEGNVVQRLAPPK